MYMYFPLPFYVNNNVIHISFIRISQPEENLSKYLDTFDIVLIDDQTMDIPRKILSLVVTSKDNWMMSVRGWNSPTADYKEINSMAFSLQPHTPVSLYVLLSSTYIHRYHVYLSFHLRIETTKIKSICFHLFILLFCVCSCLRERNFVVAVASSFYD